MILNQFKKFFDLETRTKYFVHVLFCFFIASILVFWLLLNSEQTLKEKKVAARKPDPFATLEVEAKSAVVWDTINQREIFTKNPDEPLPLASLTKVMTAVIAKENLNDDQNIEITTDDLKAEGDSKLVVGDNWTVKNLRDFTLLTSSNDGALALASVIAAEPQFVATMNQKAQSIGLLSSKFFNENGLDINTDRGGAYGSAKDMATLFEYTLKNYPEILEATRYKNLEFQSAQKNYPAENTNSFVDQIPNLLASKTGYTDLAGGNLVVAFDAGLGRPIIISVLGSSAEGRFSDALKLVDASLQYIQQER